MRHLLIYFHMYLADRLISHLSLKPKLHFIPLVSQMNVHIKTRVPYREASSTFFSLTMAFQKSNTQICFTSVHFSTCSSLLANTCENEGRDMEGTSLLLLESAGKSNTVQQEEQQPCMRGRAILVDASDSSKRRRLFLCDGVCRIAKSG